MHTVKLAGHPVHPILIVFPLGLLSTSLIFDFIYLSNHSLGIASASYWMLSAGIIGGVAAAVVGFIDWLAIPSDTREHGLGLFHGLGNAIVLILFASSWLLRYRDVTLAPPTGAIVASTLGLALAVVTGWMGGELVTRLGVGVDPAAHLNAPSSLSQLPASEIDTESLSRLVAARLAIPLPGPTYRPGPPPGRTAGLEDPSLARREEQRPTKAPQTRDLQAPSQRHDSGA